MCPLWTGTFLQVQTGVSARDLWAVSAGARGPQSGPRLPASSESATPVCQVSELPKTPNSTLGPNLHFMIRNIKLTSEVD